MTTLQDLIDERDVVAAVVRYATALDTRDWALLATCFTPDAEARYAELPACQGFPAIEALCRAALEPLDRSHHLLGNHVVVLDGDEASAECYLQAQHVREATEGGVNYVMAGRYRDRIVRTPEGWRIADRHLEIWWTEGNPAVVGG